MKDRKKATSKLLTVVRAQNSVSDTWLEMNALWWTTKFAVNSEPFTGLSNFNEVEIFLFVEMEEKLESEEALSTDTAHDRAKLIEQYQVRVFKNCNYFSLGRIGNKSKDFFKNLLMMETKKWI